MRAFLLPLLASCILCPVPATAKPEAEDGTAASPPNILLILVDDMGYGDLKSFNPNSKIPTPHLDKLAADGMRFTDAHAPGPLCHMSRYGLMTGRYPFRTNVNVWRTKPLIEKGQITIASLLKDEGYRTSMVGKWHLGFKENGYEHPLPGGPVDVGFDTYFGIRASTDIPPYFYIRGDRAVQPPTDKIAANKSEGWSPIQGAFWRAGGIAPNLELDEVLPKFTNEAIQIINGHKTAAKPPASPNNKSPLTTPLFLYLAYPAPHTPWLPSDQFKGKSGAGMYGEFVTMVDAEIGRVLEALGKAGLAQDTLLIFSSDNGPVWYEEDVKRFSHDSSGGLRGMKADAWEAGHRMPFIVRWPGKVKGGNVAKETICFTDFLATFADLCDVTLDGEATRDSESFLPLLSAKPVEDTAIRSPIVMKSGSGAMMIRDGDWKLIDRLGSGGFSKPNKIKPVKDGPQGQLYNLATDPGEAKNLWSKRPAEVARLTKKLKEIVAE